MKRISFLILLFFFIGLCVELFLRFQFGFCNALLYQSSDKYEYIAQPNQDRYRFRAHIRTNSYSQRNEEPDSTKIKILGLGDSVLFGGTWMDQDSLATTLFSRETGMQMLNISAGSWGPDNCAAYLEKRGTFNAKAMILVCSSHDAYDIMSFFPVVGNFPTYPDKQYSLAVCELIERYLIPRWKMLFAKYSAKLDPDAAVVKASQHTSVARKSAIFDPGFDQLKAMADSLHIPFGIYLHAETGELQRGTYNDMGQQICQWAETNSVPLMKGLENGEKTEMYKDIIHFNEKGQRHLADCLKKMVGGLLHKNENKQENSNTPT